jgi:hypothetical protein
MSDRARKPIPQPAPESVPYWEAARRHEFLLPKCNACEKFWFPPSQSCPHCLAVDFAFKPLSGRGKVYSFVTFHRVSAFAGGPGAIPGLCLSARLRRVDHPEVRGTAVRLHGRP